MALVRSDKIEKVEKFRNSVHNLTIATYCIFEEGGNKYFQMDTYGSNERVMTEKVSQSIQFDKSMAIKLVEILRKEFDI